MIYKGFTVTAHTTETVYAEYELEDWDMVGDCMEEYDGANFTINEYEVYVPDLGESKYFDTPEETKKFIDGLVKK